MTPQTLPARLLAAQRDVAACADESSDAVFMAHEMAQLAALIGEAAAALSAPESLEAVTQLEWSATLCDGKNVDYATAEKACAALGEGWRLPTRQELESILDLTRYNPCADTDRFPDTKSAWYWSSTPCAWSSDLAWHVSFDDGYPDLIHRSYDVCCVRAVRSLPSGQ